jgi:hypothetical protein
VSWAHGALFSETGDEVATPAKQDAIGETQYQGLFQQPPASENVDFEADDFS